jgi:chromosome segregation ATPase
MTATQPECPKGSESTKLPESTKCSCGGPRELSRISRRTGKPLYASTCRVCRRVRARNRQRQREAAAAVAPRTIPLTRHARIMAQVETDLAQRDTEKVVLEERLAEVEERAGRLERELDQVKSEHGEDVMKMERLIELRDTFQTKIQVLEDLNRGLHERAESDQTRVEDAEQTAQNRDDELRSAEVTIQTHEENIELLERLLDERNQELQDARGEAERLSNIELVSETEEEQHDQALAELADVHAELGRAQAHIEKLTSANTVLSDERSQRLELVDRLQTKLSGSRRQVQALEARVTELRESEKDLEHHNEALRRDNERLLRVNEEAQVVFQADRTLLLRKLHNGVEAAETERDAAVLERDEVKASLDAAQRAVTSLRRDRKHNAEGWSAEKGLHARAQDAVKRWTFRAILAFVIAAGGWSLCGALLFYFLQIAPQAAG